MKLIPLLFLIIAADLMVLAQPLMLISYPDHPVVPLFMPVIEKSY